MLLPAMSSEYNQIKAVLLARGPSEQTLKELHSVYTQTKNELTPNQISDIPKVLPVIFQSALDDDENIRIAALPILKILAKSLEQNQYLKSGDSWSKVKACIMRSLPKLTTFLENGVKEWCEIWCIIVNLHGSQLISDTTNINLLLKVVERAFKMRSDQVRLVGFTCWNAVIDNFSLVAPETNSRYLNLILIPLKALNHGNRVLCRAKLETWKHLMKQIEHSEANIKQALPSFLQFLFEEAGTLVPACHHFPEEAAQCFLDIVKKPYMFRLVPDKCIKCATKCIVSISSNSSLVQRVWNSILDGLKTLLWPDDITCELVNTMKELNYKIDDQNVFADIVIATLNSTSPMPVRVQCRHFETLVMLVLTAECLQKINENELSNFLDILKSTNQVHLNLFKDMLDSLISISNKKLSSSSKENENASILKSMRSIWLSLASTVTDWFANGGNLSQDNDKVAEEVNFIHMLLLCGCANLSCKWNKRMLKQWKELYSESYKNFILHPVIQQNQIIVDFINLLLTGIQSNKISLSVAIDVASVLLEIHHSADAENLMPYLLEIVDGCMKVLRDDIPCGMSVINHCLSVLLHAASSYHSLVPYITTITEKMSNFKQDLPALNMRIYNKIMKVHLQVLAMKQPDKSEIRPSSPTVTSFMHRLAKAKQNLSQKMAVSPLRERSLPPQLTKSPGSPSKSPNQRQPNSDRQPQEFVMIPPKPRTTPLTERQKEQLFTRSHNIPALYQDLSQDTQSQNTSFEGLVSSFENKKNSGNFLSPVRQLETDINKSDGMPESDKKSFETINRSADKSSVVEIANEAVSLEVSKVDFNSEKNKDVTKLEIDSAEKNTTQFTEVVNNKNPDEVGLVESKDLMAKKRKFEQNLKVKDDSNNMHKTLNKGNFALNRTSESNSSDNIRITRSASKPKGMRRSISLPIMGVESDAHCLRKSNLKLNKDTSEKTPRSKKRKQEERGSSVETKSANKKERISKNNLNVSVSERRITRQFSENISILDLGNGIKGNTPVRQKREDIVQKNASEVINDISTEKQDDTLKSKPRRVTRKSVLNSNITMKKTEEFVPNETTKSLVKMCKIKGSSEGKNIKSVTSLSDPSNNKEPFSVSAVTENVSDEIEANGKKSCASNEENHTSVNGKHQLENNRLNELEVKSTESSEEGRLESTVTRKDDISLKNTEKIPVKAEYKSKHNNTVLPGDMKERHTDSVCKQAEKIENPVNAEETNSEDTVKIKPTVVMTDQCNEELCDIDQIQFQIENVDGNSNIQSVENELNVSSVKKSCANEKKLVVLLEPVETDKIKTVSKEQCTNKCDEDNNKNKHIVKEVPSDRSDAVQQAAPENGITKNVNKSYNSLLSKELKVILQRSPVKQGITYVASKIVSPVKIRRLDISGDQITATPKESFSNLQKNKMAIEPALVEANITAKISGDISLQNKLITESVLEEGKESATKTSYDNPQENKKAIESVPIEVSITSKTSDYSARKNNVITGSSFIEGSTAETCNSSQKNKTSVESTLEVSVTTKTLSDSPQKNNVNTGLPLKEESTAKISYDSLQQNKTAVESTHVEESATRKVSVTAISPQKKKVITDSTMTEESTIPKMSSNSQHESKMITRLCIAEDSSEKVTEPSNKEALRSDFELHVDEVNFHETFVENSNENMKFYKITDSSDLNSVALHNVTRDIHKQESIGNLNKNETRKMHESSENKSQKSEELHKKAKVTYRKNAEHPVSPGYNKKSSDPKKQTTLTTLNKWILRTPTKKLSSDDANNLNTNPTESDTLNDSKCESQIMLHSQDIVESSQELLPNIIKNCSIDKHDRLHNNCELDAKANGSIILQNLLSNSQPETDTKANCNIVFDRSGDKDVQEANIRTSPLRKTRVSQYSSPMRSVDSVRNLTPLQESSKNVNHIQKCTPTKKSVCRRLDKEIEGMHKANSLEWTEKENCTGLCKCKYTNKLETLPINPAFQVDSGDGAQQCVDSDLTNIVCNRPEYKQIKSDVNLGNFDDDDDDTDDDDIFDIKRPRKTVNFENQPDTVSFYFAGHPRTRNFIMDNSNTAAKNGSPVHIRAVSVKETELPFNRTVGETNNYNGSPVSRKLGESPTKNGSPPNSRILKNEIQVSPRTRTAQLIELAKQDPTGIRNFYSPVKIGSAKARRIRPTRVLGNELSSVDIGGAKEDWVCHKYSPLASPNTSILKRKICETPDIITPNSKRKRVSFCDPPVSESLVFSNNEPGKGQIQRPEQKKGLNGYIDVDSLETEAGSNDPVFPPLELCRHPVTKVLEKFISSHWLDHMEACFEKMNVHTVGDFSTMSEAVVYKLMCSSFKLEMLKQALQEYYDSTFSEDFPHSNKSALLDTNDNDLQGIAALPSESPETKQVIFTEVHEKISEQNYNNITVDSIVNEIEKNPDIVDNLGDKLDLDIIMKMLRSAVNKLKHSNI